MSEPKFTVSIKFKNVCDSDLDNFENYIRKITSKIDRKIDIDIGVYEEQDLERDE